MQNLLNDIRSRSFKQIYLLYGEELYLRDQYAVKLRNALIPPEDTVNLSQYEGKAISVSDIIDQAETMPFFSERRLLLIKNSGFFKEAQEQLAKYLESVPDSTVLIFVESEADKRTKMYKAVSKYGRVVEFSKQTEETLKKWILSRIAKEGKKIKVQTLELFLEKTGSDMNLISTELEKLLSYTLNQEVITEEDVDAICSEQITNKIFEMVAAISEKNQRKALDLYYDLLTLKEPPMRILYLIARQFNQILQIRELLDQGYSQNAIAEKLKIRSFIVKNVMRQASHFSAENARYALETAVAREQDVKTGKLGDKLAVELIIVEMSRIK